MGGLMLGKMTILFIFVAAILLSTSANSKMYKWVDENGKTHFTNTVPPSKANNVESSHESKVDPSVRELQKHMEESATREQQTVKNTKSNRKRAYQQPQVATKPRDPRCNELLNELRNLNAGRASKSIGEMVVDNAKRNHLRDEYELRCMSNDARQSRQQDRQMSKINKKLNQIQNKQREIQNTQRGTGY